MPRSPRSQPRITWPLPSWKENGCPLFQEASNSSPVEKVTPAYWTVSLSPGLAARPLPLTMSFLCNLRGTLPVGFAIAGFCEVSLRLGAAALSAPVVCVRVGGLASGFEARSSSPPQPASADSTTQTLIYLPYSRLDFLRRNLGTKGVRGWARPLESIWARPTRAWPCSRAASQR